jgi:hypothetical protein
MQWLLAIFDDANKLDPSNVVASVDRAKVTGSSGNHQDWKLSPLSQKL